MAQPLDPSRIQALQSLAVTTIRHSRRHLATSVVLCAAILGWYATRGAPFLAFATVGILGGILVIYNLARISRARSALAKPDQLPAFVAGQRKSRRIRGPIYLFIAPVIAIATWWRMLQAERNDTDAWIVLVLATVALAAGWVWWWMVLRRMNGPNAHR